MLKKWLYLLLLCCFGLKSISSACQPIACTFQSGFSSQNIADKENASNFFTYLLAAFSDDNTNDDDGFCKHLDDDISVCQQKQINTASEALVCVQKHVQNLPTSQVKTKHPFSGRQNMLPALHHFLFRLTPF